MRGSWLRKGLLMMLCGLLFAGCASRPAQNNEESSSLKVMFMDESYFYQEYGDLFAIQHPNVAIEVVSTNKIYNNQDDKDFDASKAFDEFIEKEQPDVVVLDSSKYEKYVTDGKLMELDTLIERDKYDIETIYPALIQMLKESGGGKLYGLSPTFYGNAIFYNADLFAKYGIEVPHDGITWKELLDLARRFPVEGDKDSRVYGFGRQYGMSMDNLASTIASTQGLQFLNPDTMKVTINTDSWKQAYKLAMDALDSGAVYNPEDNGFQGGTMEEYYKSQVFVMGRMAMTIDGVYLLSNLKQAQDSIKDYKPFQIGIAAGPVDPGDPETSRNVYFNDIFGIRANSPNAEAAWEFIKFINSEQFAKVKSRTLNNGLPSRMGISKEYNGVNLESFYKLKPKMNNDNRSYEKVPNDFYMQYQPVMDREMKLVQEKKKSIDEALQTIQDEAQAILDKAVADEAAKKGSSDQKDSESSTDGAATESGSTDAVVNTTEDTTGE
ncbi:ABC transporter substrate-binding protein [Paenibacillus phocaensis]|uniref:ABC transporter substrate-binding protein n=1 Tax=Paenibacillus phocaensis TaxID=1776378 RepID=UPI0003A15D2E|nr:extracellular solute-binding protein [Paenibacillus phocaensis]